MKDREAIFMEFITAMRKREKEDSKSRGEKVSLACTQISIYSISLYNKNVVFFRIKKSIDLCKLSLPCWCAFEQITEIIPSAPVILVTMVFGQISN